MTPPATLAVESGSARALDAPSSAPSQGTPECAGVVLAGGLSSRMGTPKAWLSFGAGTLLERVVARLREVFGEVLVVGAEGQDLPDAGVPIVRDRRSARGPLAGLEAALTAVSAPAVFAVSCDSPFLQPALARRMARFVAGPAGSRAGPPELPEGASPAGGPSLSEHGFEAAVPCREGRLDPLLAAYRTSLLPRVSALLDSGRLRPAFLLEESRTRIVQESELLDVDPARLSFVNMNGPEDYRAALAAAPPRVTFELFGQPCLLAGAREVVVDVPPPTTLASALAALSRSAPALRGPVLDPSGWPGTAFLLSVEGLEFTRDPLRPVEDGERLLLMAASAGG